MNWEWISEKGASLTAGIIGLGFLFVAYLDRHYRYFHLCVAAIALAYAYRQYKRPVTPFEKREREIRRRRL
jgi:4-hydroxybenzoate polyprenyltransferase